MTTAQQALQGNIERGFTAVDAANNDLMTQAELPPLGTDPVSHSYSLVTRSRFLYKKNTQRAERNS